MVENCTTCQEPFGYDVTFDDPPEGEGHINVKHNPSDEPDFVVSTTGHYCSVECMLKDADNHPFGDEYND